MVWAKKQFAASKRADLLSRVRQTVQPEGFLTQVSSETVEILPWKRQRMLSHDWHRRNRAKPAQACEVLKTRFATALNALQ